MSPARKPQGSGRIVGHARAADNSAEFHAFFSRQFLQRYADLFQALVQPVQHVALLNPFTDVNDCDELGLESYYRSGVISCLRHPEPSSSYLPPPQCPYTQLKQFYWLDFASVLPPLVLGVQPHHTVLDMCAAPGGKSLILAQQLLKGSSTKQLQQPQQDDHAGPTADLLQQLTVVDDVDQQQRPEGSQLQSPEQIKQQQAQQVQPPSDSAAISFTQSDIPHADAQRNIGNGSDDAATAQTNHSMAAVSRGRLVCNELDPVRRQRLTTVINSHIPGSLRRHVRVVGHDATKYWSTAESGMYDRVLVDAPCSSERHVAAAACQGTGLVSASSWSVTHCNQLAALQLKLLLAGLRALKPGGRLVYSTCSLADVENDQVVEKALQPGPSAAVSPKGSECRIVAVPIDEWQEGKELEDLVGGDRTRFGLLCLPDKKGSGPIYLAMLEKVAS